MGFIDQLKAVGLVARVSSHLAREKFLTPPAHADPEHVPCSAEALTPAWLTAVLCRDVPGAELVDVTVTGGTDGTSSRRAPTKFFLA